MENFIFRVVLLDTVAPMFLKFSVIDSTSVWTVTSNVSMCKRIDDHRRA